MWDRLGIPPLLEKNSSMIFVNFCAFIGSKLSKNAMTFHYFERLHVENQRNHKYILK